MAEQLGRSAKREKGLTQNLLLSVVICLSVVRNIGDGAQHVLGSRQPTSKGEGESGGEG